MNVGKKLKRCRECAIWFIVIIGERDDDTVQCTSQLCNNNDNINDVIGTRAEQRKCVFGREWRMQNCEIDTNNHKEKSDNRLLITISWHYKMNRKCQLWDFHSMDSNISFLVWADKSIVYSNDEHKPYTELSQSCYMCIT